MTVDKESFSKEPNVQRALRENQDAFEFSFVTDELHYFKGPKKKPAVLGFTQLAAYIFKRKNRKPKFRIEFGRIVHLTYSKNSSFSVVWGDAQSVTLFADDPRSGAAQATYDRLKAAQTQYGERR
eukprot:RCo055620